MNVPTLNNRLETIEKLQIKINIEKAIIGLRFHDHIKR